MKKREISGLISRFATPAALIVLGLILILCPDAASALISKVIGWGFVMAGIVAGAALVVDGSWSVSRILTAFLLTGIGQWFMRNPLAWAAWGGRIIGVLLLLRGIREFSQSVYSQAKVLSAVTGILGLVLILLPMTASRMVFSLCGIVILAVGGIMLAERIWEHKNNWDDDPNIIDAL